jgi:hypothetical protein
MKNPPPLARTVRQGQLPTLSLLLLLQRTPAAPVVAAVEEFVVSSPLGTLLKSATAVAASLGTMNSLAGATPLVPTSGTEAGISLPSGTAASISFTVTPTQTPIMSWKVSGTVPPGMDYSGLTAPGSVNTQNLTLRGTPTTAGSYTATLQAFAGTGNTSFASATYSYMVTVTGSANTAPSITTQPLSQTVSVGANVTLSVVATGTPAPTYQWRKDAADLAGATTASLALNNVQTSAGGSYTVVVTNSAGSVTSTAATLTVNAPTAGAPAAPDKAGAFASDAATVTLSWLPPSTGSAPSSYKIERATNDTFTTGLVSFATQGAVTSYNDATATAGTTYFYRISSVNGSASSAPTAALSVRTPASVGASAARFVNIATRAYCSTGNNVTIGGFVIGGPDPKRVLIRAVGPSLVAQGIAAAEVLGDPVVELHHGADIIARNDNWGDNANAGEITTVGAQIGANPLSGTDTKSSALLTTLQPGVYSFIVSGAAGSSGIVLLEVYDADAAPGSARFVNIATRADATTGNGVTIGGFVIGGNGPKNVLIRAVGPTLTTQGLAAGEVLTDPVIELHQGAAIIAVNDDWSTNAEANAIVTNGARIGATPIDVADARSSALLLRLLPGVYSFIASGKSSGSGVVLVEVYDAD